VSRTTDAACSWWMRWSHTRLRCADARIYVAILATAPSMGIARAMWDAFTMLPDQRHWRCPCAVDATQTFRAVNFRVEAQARADID
jgi:hypothetical protein